MSVCLCRHFSVSADLSVRLHVLNSSTTPGGRLFVKIGKLFFEVKPYNSYILIYYNRHERCASSMRLAGWGCYGNAVSIRTTIDSCNSSKHILTTRIVVKKTVTPENYSTEFLSV